MNLYLTFFSFIILICTTSCEQGPKVMQPIDNSTSQNNSGQDIIEQGRDDQTVHKITVNDVLQSEKYTYLEVDEEGQERYWIAISKTEAEKGEKYFFTGGLLKRNFYSRDFDRNFDKIYLVSRISPVGQTGGSALQQALGAQGGSSIQSINVEPAIGGVSLSELLSSPEKYAGTEVIVKGQVVKTNNGIMNRNWLHLQDGTEKNNEKLDLTVTTNERIPNGSVVLMKGTIVLNKDFGAGYRYDVLMENAAMLK